MNNRQFIDKITESASNYPEIIYSRKGSIYTCVNPFSYHILRKNQNTFNQFDGIFVDGIFMCIFLRIVWGRKIPRLSFDMTSMANDLFVYASKSKDSIYFIGSTQDKIEKTIEVIAKSFPGLNIIGFRNGYFNSEDEKQATIDQIIKLNPRFVIVGMGSPIQDEFALNIKNKGYYGSVFTCGGFLHQTSEGLNYYPKWINKLNLRGFYRQYKERIFKRNYNTFIQFPILFIWDSLMTKLKINQ